MDGADHPTFHRGSSADRSAQDEQSAPPCTWNDPARIDMPSGGLSPPLADAVGTSPVEQGVQMRVNTSFPCWIASTSMGLCPSRTLSPRPHQKPDCELHNPTDSSTTLTSSPLLSAGSV